MKETQSVSQVLPMLLYLVAGVCGAIGQYLYKTGAARLGLEPIWRNWPIFAGIGAFCVVMGLFVLSFKLGGRLSVVYPMYATTFVWGALIGILVEREPWSGLQLAGITLIVGGCVMVAAGSPR